MSNRPRGPIVIAGNDITVGDAARQLGVSNNWIRRLLEDGALRGVQTPLGWLVDPTSVDRYRASNPPTPVRGPRRWPRHAPSLPQSEHDSHGQQ